MPNFFCILRFRGVMTEMYNPWHCSELYNPVINTYVICKIMSEFFDRDRQVSRVDCNFCLITRSDARVI